VCARRAHTTHSTPTTFFQGTQDIVKQEIHLYVNRAYSAVFYAASALLLTEGLGRSKHSGVIAAFRQHFVKPGIIEIEYSRIYGRVMDDRLASDYEIEIPVEAKSRKGTWTKPDFSWSVSRATCDRKTGYERTPARASNPKRAKGG
jgi:uncharacterized protein (UPF0332 family)